MATSQVKDLSPVTIENLGLIKVTIKMRMAFLTWLEKIVQGITNCIFQILRKKEAISTLISGKALITLKSPTK